MYQLQWTIKKFLIGIQEPQIQIMMLIATKT